MNAQGHRRILRLACVAILGLNLPRIADAHRLDEYLQASRISVESGHIDVEINLTPGAAVAEGVIAEIDRDSNGDVSRSESEAYARAVLRSISLEVDGAEGSLNLSQYRFPTLTDMRQGVGIIRLYVSVATPSVGWGPHRLRFRNTHRSDIGVYLVNALVPTDDRIRIHDQSRDFLQREYEVEYTVGSPRTSVSAASVSSAVGIVMAALFYAAARRYRLSIN